MSILEQIGLLPRAEERAERRLVASAMRGDRAAFDTLTREHAKALRGFLVRRLNLEAAEDVLQETWVAAWAALPRFTSRSRFKAWLFGIAQHKIQDHYRAQGRTPTEPLADHENVPDTRQPDPYGAVDLKHAAALGAAVCGRRGGGGADHCRLADGIAGDSGFHRDRGDARRASACKSAASRRSSSAGWRLPP